MNFFKDILIPSLLLIVGVFIVKREWLINASALSVILGCIKYNRIRPRHVLRQEYQEFELLDKTVLNHNTAIFKLPGPADSLGLPIGQHITIAADIEGKRIERSYTPISSDNDKGYFDLLIKSYPTGNISRYMAQLQIAQTISLKGPKGKMLYTPNMVRAFGMIAGGTGVTPMLQIIRHIISNPDDKTEVRLIFANVNEDDILLREDLDSIMKNHPQVQNTYVLNNPPEQWDGETGFVTADMIKKVCPAPADDIKILMCGPPPMISAMKKVVTTLGYEQPRAVSRLEDQVFAF
ncbi:NADH-cytochrome b5 reductase 1 [Neolecta irregularis DAH-3]|uniref:NADH-cytochrome b5 reductase n=1 Tax=Neolecta irregularis (strain DAH-3) TaxID=1198029 RepID=A0A1U7LNC3_NEOID|nr:NADH-cytochrome b5 reductase 1 [Neolecta irregularis DAH-3]|eukprot:OLL24147.1 NADH-cytochrome b5 reductase 1 [Neolecta irregularis DAH-3]